MKPKGFHLIQALFLELFLIKKNENKKKENLKINKKFTHQMKSFQFDG